MKHGGFLRLWRLPWDKHFAVFRILKWEFVKPKLLENCVYEV
jgi:hypothetical protein